jgi:hypothetical protein
MANSTTATRGFKLPVLLLLLPPVMLCATGTGAKSMPADRAWVFEINDVGGEYMVPVNPQVMTRIVFPEKIEKAWAVESPIFEFVASTDEVSVRPLHLAANALLNVHIRTASSKRVSLLLYIVDNNRQAISLVTFKERSTARKHDPTVRDDPTQATQDRMADEFIRQMKGNPSEELSPMETAVVDSSTLGVTTRSLRAGSALVGIYFELENLTASEYPIGALRLLDAKISRDYTAGVHFESSRSPPDNLLAVIPARGHLSGFTFVTTPLAIETPLSLLIRSGPTTVAAQIQYWELVPRSAPTKPELSLHVQAVGGAIWLGDGIDLEELDATTLKGLGVRVEYELSKRLSVEGELMGASTGDAEFRGVAYEGMQGDLMRSAALGRVQIGGVLRLGKKKIIPTVRLGLGLQGASHDAVFTPAAGASVEPDVGFELSAIVHFGAGLDVRLGEHFLAGAGVTAILVASRFTAEPASSNAIEAGLHLGYSWAP